MGMEQWKGDHRTMKDNKHKDENVWMIATEITVIALLCWLLYGLAIFAML